MLRAADLVLTLSEESSRVAGRFLPGGRVRLVPNAVEAGSPRTKERLVVFGGAVTRRKGVDVLLEAWRSLNRQNPGHGWRLVIAGPIVDRDVVPEPLDVAGVDLAGALPHDQLMDLLDRSAVAVLPSRDEAMPMFLLEAMARGNAVVATTVGGIPAVLADGAGELVPPGDAGGLASVLELLIGDDAFQRESAGRAAAAFERRYSAAAVFPVVEAAWKAAIARRTARGTRRSGQRVQATLLNPDDAPSTLPEQDTSVRVLRAPLGS